MNLFDFYSKNLCHVCGQTPCNCTHIAEEKVRLDPKCWTGKKIGNPKTKVKGGVRVNNCVPAESIQENASKLLSAEDQRGVITVKLQAPDGTPRSFSNPNPSIVQKWLDRYGLNLPHSITSKFVYEEDDATHTKRAPGVSSRVDSLVTDALKIMRGPELADAVQALKTVLGDREFSSRRGHYNFFIRQLVDMYGKQGVAEDVRQNPYRDESMNEDFEDMPDELMNPAVWKKLPVNEKYKALMDAGLVEKLGSYYDGWLNGELKNGKPYPDDVYTPYNVRKGELDLNKVYRRELAKYQDRKHSSDLTSQDREYELEIGSSGRAELIRKANELAEMKRVTLRNERLHDEEVAFQRAETIQQRKDEMKKIADKYQHDLTVIDKEHRNNMESIRTGNNHEINKIDKEYAEAARVRDWESSERDKDRPKPEKPKPEPEQEPRQRTKPQRPRPQRGDNYDQDTGEPIRPETPAQSNQWHTSQQLAAPAKPAKPGKNNDDVTDVEPKSNKPLALKEKITVVNDPDKATGIQQTGGVTHGSVYAGKPQQSYRIAPDASYTPGRPLPQSLQQKLDGESNTNRAVDNKGRTQQQWINAVKKKFPDAEIMRSKTTDGPCFAILSDGKKLVWKKAEQTAGETTPTKPATDSQKPLMAVSLDRWKKGVLARYPEARFATQKMINGATIASDRTGQVGIYDPKNSYAKVGPETQQDLSEGHPSDNDMGTTTGGDKMTLGQWKQMWMKKMPNADFASLFRSPPSMSGSAIAYFDGWLNNPDARWDPSQDVSESLADEFMKMAQAKGFNVRQAGTPEQERQRSQERLAQRKKEQEEKQRQNAQADFDQLSELKAKYQEMRDLYKSLGGSDWQYADREQNLTDRERQARGMENELSILAGRIRRAEQLKEQSGLGFGEAKHEEKIAGRYDPDDFDNMVKRLGQRAREQEKSRPVDVQDLARKLRAIEQSKDEK